MPVFVWIAVAMVSVVLLIALGLRQRSWHIHPSRFDVGSVSEGWLAEQSGRRDS